MKKTSSKKVLKNIKALSTVVTTLIILVISVLLATVVTYFAINVVSTRVQEESLHITKHHIWHTGSVSGGNSSCASVMIINTGGRDIVMDKLSVRGQECYWNQNGTPIKCVYYCRTTNTISEDLPFPEGLMKFNGINFTNRIQIGTTTYNFTVASNDLILKSGWTLIAYVINPDSISLNDIGLTLGITIYTAQTMYYRECNVQAYFSE